MTEVKYKAEELRSTDLVDLKTKFTDQLQGLIDKLQSELKKMHEAKDRAGFTEAVRAVAAILTEGGHDWSALCEAMRQAARGENPAASN